MRTILSLAGVCALLLVVPAVHAQANASVEGTVTYKGQPLATGKISFFQEKGKPITATIKDGKYTLKDLPEGEYQVTFESKRKVKKDKDKEEEENLLPAKYGNQGTTPLKASIKAGKNAINFALQ